MPTNVGDLVVAIECLRLAGYRATRLAESDPNQPVANGRFRGGVRKQERDQILGTSILGFELGNDVDAHVVMSFLGPARSWEPVATG
ncbi:hypothetical protein BWP39_17260 [Paraburkholderia acidicola]|uniref:Uncharacterized protein n=1 Tax=Paraburkholderia acidicola TaxID=1912599 RepID=A0A2A4F1N9_9BURK|nr:hypothetical protein BWP39_17260 [Paraburkholderia acidicola]